MRREIFQKAFFRLRYGRLLSAARKIWWQAQGASIGRNTNVPRLAISWPHQISIGNDCVLEDDIHLKWDGIWKPGPSIVIGNHTFLGRGCEFNIRGKITVGNNCLIASGCKFIDHDHCVPEIGDLIGGAGTALNIELGDNVWLGVNVVVLKGVRIGCGAVVGAGAVVTKSIPDYEIWLGVPASRIGRRSPRLEPAS